MKKEKGVAILMLYLVLFALVFTLAAFAYFKNYALISLGKSARTVDGLLMIFSFAGICKSIYDIHKY